ncbi:FAD-dependent oxidoreductase [Actinophytocola oryzae]|uniref:2-polyprenyl-6-methoxyphenol hydroxylase-like FAD-dependent oxidoreductase n=1 Tax=Actinophytocola oryzae TaxID=502181 RepID=A0A4V3FUD3_9PSEU|nr:NAD(P)/FAD-dependent oxidoreductase [Actinophytocola oryzae]TDV54801.1 2-polyprenyl-6-methoxyphenol hydroxylase-like FAD-dependent oxidoreductase [Actinophytocola oryzae]
MIGNVAIIGGGTGGLCLAQVLHRAGVRVSVHERSRARTERMQGYSLHINPVGSRVLHDVLPPEKWRAFLATAGAHSSGFGFLDEQLHEMVVIDDARGRHDPAWAYHSVSRITLHQLLLDGVADVVEYDHEFERYERNPDGTVTCHFVNGDTVTADVVVGADGARSRVRGQYLPHADRVHTGLTLVAGKYPLTAETRGTLPARMLDGPNTVLAPGGCGLFVSPHDIESVAPHNGIGADSADLSTVDPVLFDNTSSYMIWAFVAGEYPGCELSSMDGLALRDMVAERTAAWHPRLGAMITGSPVESISVVPILTSVSVPRWPTTNITLLGDAIHSMTPFRGVGASVAMHNAAHLGRNLVAADRGDLDVLAALRDFERHMTLYGFAAVRDSLRAAREMVSGARVGSSLDQAISRFFPGVSKDYWRVAL